MKTRTPWRWGWEKLPPVMKTAVVNNRIEREQSAEFKTTAAALAWQRDSKKRKAARAKSVRVRCIKYILQKRGRLAAA